MVVENTILVGHVLDRLAELQDKSHQMAATSPPYWGLRDYGIEPQDWPEVSFSPVAGLPPITIPAQRVCLGLEADPWAFVSHLVLVGRALRRVLRDDGVLFLNLGDSYANDDKWGGSTGGKHASGLHGATSVGRTKRHTGLKPKDLCGIPWRVAFALQADGWHLRSDVIWEKPACMPESCRDRPTRSHEYVFMLSKGPRYFWDKAAVAEPDSGQRSGNGFVGRQGGSARVGPLSGGQGTTQTWEPGAGRNLRTVWRIGTQPFKGAHYATWPEALVERMIRAATSEHGCCPTCGTPWTRITERPKPPRGGEVFANTRDGGLTAEDGLERTGLSHFKYDQWLKQNPARTVGWSQGCSCHAAEPAPCLVLDPFGGSGTTGQVARSLGRAWTLIEANPSYAADARVRVESPTRAELATKPRVKVRAVRDHEGAQIALFQRPDTPSP